MLWDLGYVEFIDDPSQTSSPTETGLTGEFSLFFFYPLVFI